jgi:hypothetical protein
MGASPLGWISFLGSTILRTHLRLTDCMYSRSLHERASGSQVWVSFVNWGVSVVCCMGELGEEVLYMSYDRCRMRRLHIRTGSLQQAVEMLLFCIIKYAVYCLCLCKRSTTLCKGIRWYGHSQTLFLSVAAEHDAMHQLRTLCQDIHILDCFVGNNCYYYYIL